jgi:hypothetical protein
MMTDAERESRKHELEAHIEALRTKQQEIADKADTDIRAIEWEIGGLQIQIRRIDRLSPHGTPACYARGCRCDGCRTAMTQYQRERAKARKNGDCKGIVPADEVRAHLEKIKAAGASMSLLSRLVKVDSFYLHGVRTGYKKNIRADFAAAILSWTPEIVAGERKVRTTSARLHIEALEQQGLSLAQIALMSKVDESTLAEVKTNQYIETRIERAILAVA